MLTLGQAARLTGLSKSTLSRALSSGRLSGRRLDDGSFEIDPSELIRVYKVRPEALEGAGNGMGPGSVKRGAIPPEVSRETNVAIRLAAAEAELAGLKALLSELRESRDGWKAQAERLAIRDMRGESVIPMGGPQARRGWWPFGRTGA